YSNTRVYEVVLLLSFSHLICRTPLPNMLSSLGQHRGPVYPIYE
ncbi:3883_t:CDS:2, partial [Acaulospora colombiana]